MKKFLPGIITGFIALFWSVLVLFVAGSAIDTFRSVPGETASITWNVFVTTTFVFQVVPCVITGIILGKTLRRRLFFVLIALLLIFGINYGLDGFDFLNKAWRRGL